MKYNLQMLHCKENNVIKLTETLTIKYTEDNLISDKSCKCEIFFYLISDKY